MDISKSIYIGKMRGVPNHTKSTRPKRKSKSKHQPDPSPKSIPRSSTGDKLQPNNPPRKGVIRMITGGLVGGDSQIARKAQMGSSASQGHDLSPLTLGEVPLRRTCVLKFLVVDIPFAYNVILGRPTLNSFRAIISTYHMKIKFPVERGVGEDKADPLKEVDWPGKRDEIAKKKSKLTNLPSSLHTPTVLDKAYDDHASWHSHLSPYPRYSLRMHVTTMSSQVRGLIQYYRNQESQSYRPSLKRLPYDDSLFSESLYRTLDALSRGSRLGTFQDRPSRVSFIAAKLMHSPTTWVYPFGLWAFRCDIDTPFDVSGGGQIPIYYVSKVLNEVEERYPPLEKMALALVITVRRLRSYFISHPIGGKDVECVVKFDFKASNNETEYEALVLGMRMTRDAGAMHLIAYFDSQLIVKQVKGKYKAKEESMIQYLQQIEDLKTKFKSFQLQQIPMEDNAKSDYLSELTNALED
ncbi:hypothetical protein Sango_2500400 [Sesamum angolense]|uniref:RNase H type-1 domain-containing protein n=1 Tax=Sesamum angolense TaxID=2727404 RepID=A0AAE2BI64_9LAMI|nr:hypothetical protein Sango_2500400 [Sesamum angolense]